MLACLQHGGLGGARGCLLQLFTAASPAPASSSRRCGLVLNYSVTEQQDGTNQLRPTQIAVQRCVTIVSSSGSVWAGKILCASHMRLLHVAILL